MIHAWKKNIAALLAVFAVALCLAGCGVFADNLDPTDPTDPAANVTTVPTDTPTEKDTAPSIGQHIGPNILGTAELKQLRLPGYDENWVKRFRDTVGDYRMVQDTAGLADAFASISGLGRNLEVPQNYDDAFFAENYLVLIPASSGSGSIRYVADAFVQEEIIRVVLEGKMPDIGTADMADWLLLVVLPKDQFAGDLPVEIQAPDYQGTSVGGNLNITDR